MNEGGFSAGTGRQQESEIEKVQKSSLNLKEFFPAQEVNENVRNPEYGIPSEESHRWSTAFQGVSPLSLRTVLFGEGLRSASLFAIRAAVAPAPKPLSMFTTVRPGAHD